MTTPNRLTDVDLARPAKSLPVKVIRALGHQLHRHLSTGGNWEVLAEELGYEYENIKRFADSATIRQEMTPGELVLRDWVEQCSPGHTLYVLKQALCQVERYDCAEYMEKEVLRSVIHMDLAVCIRDEACPGGTQHICVRTRSDASLLDSLQNVLQQPVNLNYKFLDHGATWTSTLAKQFKGRALMLQKIDFGCPIGVDQDPTVDSSSMEDEPVDILAGFNPALSSRVSRGMAFNPTDLQQHLASRHNIKTLPHSTTTGCGRTVQSQRRCTSGMAGSSHTHASAGLNSGHMIHQNSHCDSCTCENSTQNNLNAQQLDITQSDRLSMTDNRCMNIHETEVKIDNVVTQRSMSGGSIVQAEAETIVCNGETETQRNVIHGSSDAMMMDTDYQECFEDIQSYVIHGHASEMQAGQEVEIEHLNLSLDERLPDTDIFVTHLQSDSQREIEAKQELEMENLKLSFDETLSYPETSGTNLSQVEKEHASNSSESDKEFVDQKFTHFDDRDKDQSMSESGSFDHKWQNLQTEHVYQNQYVDTLDIANGKFCEKNIASSANSQLNVITGIIIKRAGSELSSMEKQTLQFREHIRPEEMVLEVEPKACQIFGPFETNLNEEVAGRNTQDCPYIDFNNFKQTSPDRLDPDFHSFNRTQGQTDKTPITANGERDQAVYKGGQGSSKNSQAGCRYERLQHQISCPSDLRPYDISENAFSTIADVFSPVLTEPADSRVSYARQQEGSSIDNIEDIEALPADDVTRCKSFSGRRQGMPINSNRAYRHTFPHGQRAPSNKVCFSNQEMPATSHEESCSLPPPRPHKFIKVRSHPYKVVVRGRPEKRDLDGALVGDNLFSFYNNKLCGEMGWSPLETEDTVETTMRDIVQQDGFYIIWYNRTKKNLMLTVSERRACVHIRVHSKLHDNHMHFYITPGCLYRDVCQLLQECFDQGLSLNSEQGLSLNSSEVGTGQCLDRITWMKCPVKVQYEKKPAVSV